MMEPEETSDEALMHDIGAGSETAFAALMRRHLDRVFSICMRRLGNAEEAEEAAQEVFAAIWRTADRWQQGEAKFTTWLYRVSVNKSTDMLRRRKPLNPLESIDEPTDETVDILSELEKKNDRKLLLAAFNKLSAPQRDAIEMVYFAEMGQKQAAEALGVSVAALESSLRRGREKLYKVLKKHQQNFGHLDTEG
ncbi:MAG: sigma-70 family RNA polymerase sigma factor [Parvibaculales bacterium]